MILPPRIDLTVTEEGFSIQVGPPPHDADWWVVSTTAPGAFGCRDKIVAGDDPASQPVALGILDVTDGWYTCVDIDNFSKVAQVRFLDVVPDGWVQLEIIVWDLAG